MAIPYTRPTIRRKDMDSVLSCMVSDQLSSGQQNEEFVSQSLDYFGLDGGLAFRDPEVGFSYALLSLGLEKGSRIGLSVLSLGYIGKQIKSLGYEPVFYDVHEGSGTLDVQAFIEEFENDPVAGLVVSGTLGFLPEIGDLLSLNIPIIEDITTIIGGVYSNQQPAGSLGNVVILRLEAEDLITTGGGLLVLTKGKKESRILNSGTENLQKTALMSDMNASLGKIQLKELKNFILKRTELFEIFLRSVMRSHHQTLHQQGDAQWVPYGLTLRIKGSVADVRSFALKKGVDPNLAFEDSCFHDLNKEADEEMRDLLPRKFPIASQLFLQCLLFPLFPSMTGKEVGLIEKLLIGLP